MHEVEVIEIPADYRLSVLLPGSRKVITIDGRTAKLIAWIVQNRARVERLGVGALIFNISLNAFVPEVRDNFPRVLATPESPDRADPLRAAG